MDRKIKKRENMGSVLIDNFSAMKDVAAYITADISISPGKERYEGFVEGLEENGISFNKRMHYAGTFSVETGQIGAMTLLQRNPEIDCIV